MPAPPRHQQEDGFALLETIVAAALLAVMVIAVFTTFDVANKVSGEEKARAVAASIAQREIEFMRSLPFAQLSALEEKLAQMLARLKALREENRDLRQQVAARADENVRLGEKLGAAKTRIEALLKQIPETET